MIDFEEFNENNALYESVLNKIKAFYKNGPKKAQHHIPKDYSDVDKFVKLNHIDLKKGNPVAVIVERYIEKINIDLLLD